MKTILLTLLVALSTLLTNSQAFASIELQIQAADAPTMERKVERYSYNFGRVPLYSSLYARYKLTNTGTTPLTFQQARIGGAGYSADHTCTGILQPQNVCQFTIRYNPVFDGLSSGRFILSFVENLDIVVDLWGEGYRI